MARILEYPKVQQINSREWKLLEPLEYHVGSADSSDVIIVPKDFTTDFASVPKPFWPIFPPYGRYSPASVIHDYLYGGQFRPRKECDDIFLEAMKVMEVNLFTRNTMYWAVRAFGYWSYHGKNPLKGKF